MVRNGPHDIGGARGLGPVAVTAHEAAYPEGWEARCVGAMIIAMLRGTFSVEDFRIGIEGLPPAAHYQMGYYRRWLHTLERNLVAQGVLDSNEIDVRMEAIARGASRDTDTARFDAELLAAVDDLMVNGGEVIRPLDASPAFAPGQSVRTRHIEIAVGVEHTRLPGYAQARRGIVEACHPAMVFPDTSGAVDARAEFLYTVVFPARELWPDAELGVTVAVDLFESYLDTVEASARG